jgi:uncharacterized protein (DUF1697 family)
MGKEIGVIVRTAAELKAVLKKNPFPKANPAQVGVFFFASPLSKSFMDGVVADIEEVFPQNARYMYIIRTVWAARD